MSSSTPHDTGADGARMRAILVLCGATAFSLAPFVVPPFTGYADYDPLPAQPAGYAFAIWGPIYLGLAGSAVFGLIARAEDTRWDRTRWALFASMIVGAGWLSAAIAAPVLSVVMIFVMLGGALLALWQAPGRDVAAFAVPVGLYAGWLTAASFVALGTIAAGLTGLGAALVSWGVLAGATALGLFVLARLPVPPWGYAAALGWALIGVAVALGGTGQTPLFVGTLAALGALAVAVVARLYRDRRARAA
ncbi:MAG: hypothetical protein AAF914_06825 [Pseudomonadota bacterium]